MDIWSGQAAGHVAETCSMEHAEKTCSTHMFENSPNKIFITFRCTVLYNIESNFKVSNSENVNPNWKNVRCGDPDGLTGEKTKGNNLVTLSL
jgi:hypothetical protein